MVDLRALSARFWVLPKRVRVRAKPRWCNRKLQIVTRKLFLELRAMPLLVVEWPNSTSATRGHETARERLRVRMNQRV